MRSRLNVASITVLFLVRGAQAQSTKSADDAAPLYISAGSLVADNYTRNIQPPAAANMEYPPYPPFSKQWLDMEKEDFAANVEARALAHQAREIEHANWPIFNAAKPLMYLNNCRALGDELSDAALYQHLQGNDAAAVESIRDLMHYSDLMEHEPNKIMIRVLVGIGIRELAMDRLAVITSGTALTKDPANTKAVQVTVARQLIAQLLKHEDGETQVNALLHAEHLRGQNMQPHDVDRLLETAERAMMERDLVAMSLACHAYHFDTNNWPKSLDDLHGYLPSVPLDPFGEGDQRLDYVLIKHGLPDGSDRPLVYSRCQSDDGLFVLNDQPRYSFYNGDGSKLPFNKQKHGGQFRDVASWAPEAGWEPAAMTQPVGQ